MYIYTSDMIFKVQVSRRVKVQRRFIKFSGVCYMLAVPPRGMKITILLRNTFKKEVLKISPIACIVIGSPVSFWLLEGEKQLLRRTFTFSWVLFLFLKQVKFHKGTSCSPWYLVFHQECSALQLQCCVLQSFCPIKLTVLVQFELQELPQDNARSQSQEQKKNHRRLT